jgi:hypothetical protein
VGSSIQVRRELIKKSERRTSMSLYWKETFESGAVDQADVIYRTSSEDGGWSNPLGDPVGSVVQVVASPVFKGSRACKYLLAEPCPSGGFRCAGIKKWIGLDDKNELYFGAALYVPSSFETFEAASSGWAEIMQMQENGRDSWRQFALLFIGRDPGQPLIGQIRNDFAGVSARNLCDAFQIPKDRWFTGVMYYKGGINGNIKFWLDGVLVCDHYEDFSDSDSVGPGCDVSIYAGSIAAGAYIVVDEITAASTLALATPQHNLSVTSNPSGLPFSLRRKI